MASIRGEPQAENTAAVNWDAEDDGAQSDISFREGASGPPGNPQTITVTRTLEVKPATPQSLTSGVMHPTGPRSFVQGPACNNEQLSTASSAPHLRLPDIPNVSCIDLNEPVALVASEPGPRPKTAPGPTESRSLYTTQPKLPPFMQSRRWARLCEPPRPKTSGHGRVVSEEARPMTLREVSFEQQRAAWKQLPPTSDVQAVNRAESIASAHGFCRPVSTPMWQLIRAARSTRARSEPSNNIFRKLATQRTSKASRHSRRQSVEKTPPRISRSSQMGRKRAVSDLRKRAGMNHRRDVSSHVVDLDIISAEAVIGRRPSSPVPSLHDPEKAKRFSEECEALLTNKDSEKDFLIPLSLPSRSTTSASAPSGSEICDSSRKVTNSGAMAKLRNQASKDSPGSFLAAPQPPARTSSKGGAKIATMVPMTKAACVPATTGLKDRVPAIPDKTSQQNALPAAATQSQPSKIPLRMASTASTISETSKGPRHAKSTDTLALIEAQIRTTPQTSRVESLKQKFTAGEVQNKQRGPAGTPPERPLPTLPAGSPSTRSNTPTQVSSTPSRRHSKQSQTSTPIEVQRTMPPDEAGVTPQCCSSRPPASDTSPNGLAIIYTGKELANGVTPHTPTSPHSQESCEGESTKYKFTRHNKNDFRAERIKELKQRIKADMEREHRISEEREVNMRGQQQEPTTTCQDHDSSLPPPESKLQSSLDQLDQFPAVPASRPASRASHSGGVSLRGHSRTRSHVRQTSKASSRHSYRPATSRGSGRQILGASQIKVLVDTDPVTGHFRAGAMSPEASPLCEDHGLEASPRKSTLRYASSANLPSRIDEDKQINITSPRKMNSMRSLRSHASAISARHSTTGSRQSRRQPTADTPTGSLLDSSSDDDNLLLSVSRCGKRKLRRRWNSNDIRTVQALYDELEKYYDTLIRQEQELQKQREEIRMMVRVFAPMSRAQGLKTAMFSAEKQDFVNLGIDLEDVENAPAGVVANTFRQMRNSDGRSLSEKAGASNAASSPRNERNKFESPSKARLDAASAALDSAIKERPTSNISSASATTDVSGVNRSSRDNSAAEGSMTDPVEYEGCSSKLDDVLISASHHRAAIGAHNAYDLPIRGQSLTIGMQNRGTTDVASSVKARENVPLHMPPPVASVIPRGTLSEEEEEDGFLLTTVPQGFDAVNVRGLLRSVSALSGESIAEEHRLSVNHVFTRTEEMDRMLSVIGSL